MMAFLAESGLGTQELKARAARLDALILDPSIAGSEEALRLASHLAAKAFETKSAIAKRPKYEFLLWLTGKTDIRSALARSAPKDPKDILIVVFDEQKKHALEALGAKEKKKPLEKKADALELEGISLSRTRN